MHKRVKAEKTGRVKTKSTKRLRKLKFGSGLYIAPSLIGVLLFFIIPFLVVIFYSVVDNPISMNFVFLDNFERAIESIKNDKEKDNKNMLTGIEMIYAELKNTLINYGVKEISEIDVPFDANIHNAIMVDENQEKCDDTVLEIMMKGYIYRDRVIRPAMVKVNKIN